MPSGMPVPSAGYSAAQPQLSAGASSRVISWETDSNIFIRDAFSSGVIFFAASASLLENSRISKISVLSFLWSYWFEEKLRIPNAAFLR